MNGLKKLTDKEYYDYIEDLGHRLIREADGGVDYFALDVDNHNGPMCERCYDAWCHHCRDKVERCEKSYTGELAFPDPSK